MILFEKVFFFRKPLYFSDQGILPTRKTNQIGNEAYLLRLAFLFVFILVFMVLVFFPNLISLLFLFSDLKYF